MTTRFVTTLTTCLAVVWLCQSAAAATITVINTDGPDANTTLDPIVVSEAPTVTAPVVGSVGTDGYKFFAFVQNPASSGYGSSSNDRTSLPVYVTTIANTGDRWVNTGNSLFTVAGTTYTAGYITGSHSATITFGAGTPNLIRIGLLMDTSSGSGDRAINPTISSPTDSFTSFNLNYAYNPQGTHFVFLEVSGLQTGDQLRISGKSHLSGITFDTIPEPASLALLAMGALMMCPRRRA
jgi:hypothetical protein